VRNIIKEIENGNASESNIVSLCELLEIHQNMIPESIRALNKIMIKSNIKASHLAICALNKISENHIGLEYYSIYAIISCVMEKKNDLREYVMLEILEILLKITQKYPERMKIAVPELLICLENTNAINRNISYFMLSILANAHHEFFKGHSKEIIRVLNGPYVDERIYACRLIKQLSQKDQTIVNDTYYLLEDLLLNHNDPNLRSEAGFTMDKLKEAVGKNYLHVDRPVMIMQKPDASILLKDKLEISENYFSGLMELRSPNKNDLIDILEGMNLTHMIINR
jgi:hypothetical protein